jgi:ketosteroid isomerase-like protein
MSNLTQGHSNRTARRVPTAVLAVVLAGLLASVPLSVRADDSAARVRIAAVLDDFHAAAAAGDRDRYLGHFAPNGVFMGTDDWERWPLDEFTTYVTQRFEEGGGWTYTSEQRHIAFSADGDTAWFDEIMLSPRWGRFRGTGVLTLTDGTWKLAHYSLTALVPNERFEDVSAIATEGFAQRKEQE